VLEAVNSMALVVLNGEAAGGVVNPQRAWVANHLVVAAVNREVGRCRRSRVAGAVSARTRRLERSCAPEAMNGAMWQARRRRRARAPQACRPPAPRRSPPLPRKLQPPRPPRLSRRARRRPPRRHRRRTSKAQLTSPFPAARTTVRGIFAARAAAPRDEAPGSARRLASRPLHREPSPPPRLSARPSRTRRGARIGGPRHIVRRSTLAPRRS
jgi:hypothetical protein